MADLREEVASRLRDSIHGREIDSMEDGMPRLPHMLGVVNIGDYPKPKDIDGSILDPNHEFWNSYYESVDTRSGVEREVESAIRSLESDGTLEMSTPYGEEAGIWYCEIEELDQEEASSVPQGIETKCIECNERANVSTDIQLLYDHYRLTFTVDCESCDFSDTFGYRLRNL